MTNLELLQRKLYDNSLSLLDLYLVVELLIENEISLHPTILRKRRDNQKYTITDLRRICDTLNRLGYNINKTKSVKNIIADIINSEVLGELEGPEVYPYTDTLFLGAGTPTGASAVGDTCTSNAPLPAVTIEAGDLIVIEATSKLLTCIPNNPTDFRRLVSLSSWNGSNGGDVGGVMVTTFIKEAVGGENGNITVTLTNGNSLTATCYVFRKDPTAYWNIEVIGGEHNVLGSLDCSILAYERTDAKLGDTILVASGGNIDTIALDSPQIIQTGVTFTTLQSKVVDSAITNGNDQRHFSSLYRVTSGNRENHSKMLYTGTFATVNANAPTIMTNFVRIRQTDTPQVFKSSGYQCFDPDQVENSNIDTRGGIWNGLKAENEGANNNRVETYLGQKHFVLETNLLTNATQVERRQEIVKTPDQPRYIQGSKQTCGYKMRLPLDWVPPVGTVAEENGKPVIINQDHTGTAPGFEGGGNHPLWHIECGYQDQQGKVAGSITVSRGTGAVIQTRNYAMVNELLLTAGGEYNWITEVLYHTTAGYLYIECNGIVLVNDTNIATIATTDDQLGSNSLFGGRNKLGPYMHQFDDQADCLAAIALGFNGWKQYMRKIHNVLRMPTDIDIADNALARATCNPVND